jgi:hypothetical protein
LIGGGCRFRFSWPVIADHVVDRNNLDSLNLCGYLFEYLCRLEDLEPALTGCIAACVPLVDPLPHLTRAELTSISKVHNIRIMSQLNVADTRKIMEDHTC